MLESQMYQCPYCWGEVEALLDLSAGDQEYVEDCPVCSSADQFFPADRWRKLVAECARGERLMQRIYEPQDLLEAELLLGMLASEGVEAYLAGRHLLGAVGELPALGLLGLLVEDEEAERARRLIAAYNAAAPLPGEEPDGFPGVLLC